MLELSALNANNPAAAQTQAALISAILQSGSFPTIQDPTQFSSLLANSALAAVFQATANALTNGTFNAAAAAAAAADQLTNGKLSTTNTNGMVVDSKLDSASTTTISNGLDGNKSHQTPQVQECANCGVLSSTTQLRRFGNLAHYLCGKCGNDTAASMIFNQQQVQQQHRKNSDTTSSDDGTTTQQTTPTGRRCHSGRKVFSIKMGHQLL